jgi:uncharacterized membrane protein YagU involved in acid resistance
MKFRNAVKKELENTTVDNFSVTSSMSNRYEIIRSDDTFQINVYCGSLKYHHATLVSVGGLVLCLVAPIYYNVQTFGSIVYGALGVWIFFREIIMFFKVRAERKIIELLLSTEQKPDHDVPKPCLKVSD